MEHREASVPLNVVYLRQIAHAWLDTGRGATLRERWPLTRVASASPAAACVVAEAWFRKVTRDIAAAQRTSPAAPANVFGPGLELLVQRLAELVVADSTTGLVALGFVEALARQGGSDHVRTAISRLAVPAAAPGGAAVSPVAAAFGPMGDGAALDLARDLVSGSAAYRGLRAFLAPPNVPLDGSELEQSLAEDAADAGRMAGVALSAAFLLRAESRHAIITATWSHARQLVDYANDPGKRNARRTQDVVTFIARMQAMVLEADTSGQGKTLFLRIVHKHIAELDPALALARTLWAADVPLIRNDASLLPQMLPHLEWYARHPELAPEPVDPMSKASDRFESALHRVVDLLETGSLKPDATQSILGAAGVIVERVAADLRLTLPSLLMGRIHRMQSGDNQLQ